MLAGLYLADPLSAGLLLLVGVLALVILRFSINYLDGDPRRRLFLTRMSLALAAVATLVSTNHLTILVLAWIGASAALHSLLLFHRDRPRAIVAARKKMFFARLGDLWLLSGAALIALEFGSFRISTILSSASAAPDGSLITGIACFFLVGAAALKCAQFPSHGWLTEVMETPTPVSALLHAGIVNAGGFLLIRFADVLVLNPVAMNALVVIGGFSALFGTICMLTQTSVKVSLGYSTIAQMGFMLLQIGLGVFSAAALHLVAHSLYKAHAFLSSGRAVLAVASRQPSSPARPITVLFGLAAAGAVYAGIGAALDGTVAKTPAIMALGAIFMAGLSVYLIRSARGPGTFVVGLLISAAASLSYFLLQVGAAALLAGVVPAPREPGLFAGILMALVVASFVAVALFQSGAFSAAKRLNERAYVHLARGLYANALNDRAIGSLRLKRAA
ncbi:NADH dehydrogenase [Parvularcula lutaonensis]|nr:NADH dehydrogenase [Parvularcula lutaonensis]